MTGTSKAPTDREMMKRHDEFQARQVMALGGGTVAYTATRADMISYIEQEMAK